MYSSNSEQRMFIFDEKLHFIDFLFLSTQFLYYEGILFGDDRFDSNPEVKTKRRC